jgi:hypothetical protein
VAPRCPSRPGSCPSTLADLETILTEPLVGTVYEPTRTAYVELAHRGEAVLARP